MSKIAQVNGIKAQLAALQAQLDSLQADPEVKALQEFEKDLREVLAKHNRSLVDVNQIMDPNWKAPKGSSKNGGAGTGVATNPKPKLRVWLNPHTQEKIESTHGNNKVLNAWRQKWGKEAVASWKQPD